MNNLQSMLGNIDNNLRQGRTDEPQQAFGYNLDDWASHQVDALLGALKSQKPAWRNALPDRAAEASYKRQLVLAMLENEICQQWQLELAIKRARSDPSPWLPGSGEFIEWCTPRPEDYGLPALADALAEVNRHLHGYIEATSGRISNPGPLHQWSHPAVYWSAIQTPSFERRSMTERQWTEAYSRNYAIACRRSMMGEDLSGVMPRALPNRTGQAVTPEERAALRIKSRAIVRNLRDMIK